MRRVERERFCAPSRAFAAYAEAEPEIVPGRYLMKPRDIAKLLQLAHPIAGETALAIAAPYAAAILSVIGLKVTAQEVDPKAAALLAPVLDAYGVATATGDLLRPARSGVDLIICEAAVTRVPDAWLAALAGDGRIAVVERDGPVGRGQVLRRTAAGRLARRRFRRDAALSAGLRAAGGLPVLNRALSQRRVEDLQPLAIWRRNRPQPTASPMKPSVGEHSYRLCNVVRSPLPRARSFHEPPRGGGKRARRDFDGRDRPRVPEQPDPPAGARHPARAR